MKVNVIQTTHYQYTEDRTIEVEIPKGTKDIETYLKEYLETDEVQDELSDCDAEPDYGDPDRQYITVDVPDSDTIEWQDF